MQVSASPAHVTLRLAKSRSVSFLVYFYSDLYKNLRYQLIVIGKRAIDASADIGQVSTTLDGKILGAITCNSSRPIAPGLKRRASLEQRRVANLWQQTTIRTRAPLTTSLIQRRCIVRVHREDTIPLRPTTLTPRHIARASFTE